MKDNNYLILSNHLSYLDIFVISSRLPSVFVASVDEVRDKFLLGTITGLGGGIFIERRNRAELLKELEEIGEVLRKGINVVLFPEGTTSHGDRILAFKTPLLNPAIQAKKSVLPLCIKYIRINGEQVTRLNRDSIFFYGDMRFFEHFYNLMSINSIEAELIPLKIIETNGDICRKELAQVAFERINFAYGGDFKVSLIETLYAE